MLSSAVMHKIRFAAILCLAGLGCLIVTSASEPNKLSSFDPQANALLAKMTLDEKVGQMTQPDQSFLKSDADIVKYYLGSVLSGGDSDPKEGNSLEAWTNLIDRYQKRALETRLSIPLLYGVDAVHGHNNVLGAVIFPHNIGLGCTRNPALIEKIERITAVEVRATGINWGFAPCVDRAARHSLGPHLRRICRRAGRRQGVGGGRRARLAGRPRRSVCPSWRARSTTWATAARPTAAARSVRICWTRAIRAWMRRPCARSTCRATSPPSGRAWVPSCRPTAVGTV